MRELERSLGVTALSAIALSAMLGSGVFVLPGLAARWTGPNLWMAYVLAALCVAPAAASKAELASAMPTSGGAYVYLDRLFGPLVGTISGLALWLSSLLKAAFALLGVGLYLGGVVAVPVEVIALSFLVGIVALNWVGVKAISRAQSFVVGLTLLFLFALWAIAGFSPPSTAHELPDLEAISRAPYTTTSGGIGGLVTAAGFVIVAFNGVTKIAAIAEEVKNPGRAVPLAIFGSLAVVTVVYAVTAAVLGAALPVDALVGDEKPIFSLAVLLGGEVLGTVAAGVAVISLVSLANTGILAASRFPFAMSRDRLLPAAGAHLDERFGTPTRAIALTGASMGVAVLLFDVGVLAKLASALVIALYVAVNVAVLVFRESGVGWYRPKFKSPLYPWIQIFGIVSGLGLLLLLGHIAALGIALAAVPGALLYLFIGRHGTERRGVLFQRGRRAELTRSGSGTNAISDGALLASLPPSSGKRSSEPGQLADSLKGSAPALVAMFGDERGPETLVEIGSALAGSAQLPVIHLTEVPEQTILGAANDAPQLESLERRLSVMAREEGAAIKLHAIASRDIAQTVHALTLRLESDFLVLRWRGRTAWATLRYNPLGWLLDHLPCNLALFRDYGVRYIREILVYPSPGPNDSLVVATADDLARRWGARLTLVRPILPQHSEETRASELEYLEALARLCEMPNRIQLLEGSSVVEAVAGQTSRHDLLVMGSVQRSFFERLTGGSAERILHRAACSVLSLKTPRERTHEALRRRPSSGDAELGALLPEGALLCCADLGRKEAVFERAAQLLESASGVGARQIVDALWERERTQNTAVGHGVALPHATVEQAPRTMIALITTAKPLDHHAPDGQPVDVFFVIMSPPRERQRHLSLLARIAQLALRTDLLMGLRAGRSSEALRGAISHAEAALAARSETSDEKPLH